MKGLPIIIAALGGALVGAATALLSRPRKAAKPATPSKALSAATYPESRSRNLKALPTRLPKKSRK